MDVRQGQLAPAAAERRQAVATNLGRLRARIAAACAAAGRDPGEVTLIAVTKTYPASDVAHLAALGVPDIGENRVQEALPKVDDLRAAGVDVRWHHVGQLQRNKSRAVAGYASMVHSVDRLPLVAALGTAREEARAADGVPVLDVLLQVSLDGDTSRGGALAAELPALADAVAALPALRLAGVMAVAPLSADPGAAFAALADTAYDLRRDHPDATVVSAGMSADLEPAIACGATHVRIGSALLGARPMLG
ncbi:MAG TPA: YggS family pyridoxal phosphate-dependent enzyme [Micromonosporaceae bacterium]|nr:YggS family pyridoxal phosphate-dependent enzyme [Micromonosporaceae bacterium]